MEIITDISQPLALPRPVVTIGTFDGVHRGHQAILQKMKEISAGCNGSPVVITFHPHPRLVLGQHVYLLSTREEKRDAFAASGVTHLVEIPFTREFAKLSAEEFIHLIAQKIRPEVLVIGYDHGFGRDRGGSIEHLFRFGNELGFKVVLVEELIVDRHHVSSSVIRWLLQEGDAGEATRLLGREYSITGQVIRGNQIGKLIGYPTANLYVDDPDKLIPSMGVYASRVICRGKLYNGMTNIGMRPTINAHKLTIETNIFGFGDDIYYETITVKLVKRIRNEKKFGNLDILKNQLRNDQHTALEILGGAV
ncbi:MAG TPA: bifunctional riboflavin kinase/FAD synthetase [Lentimicrobium sp.]|nr:bifunctional riboflavin kinase/FAD synthetase [Lentimicrobium sp.]